MLAGGISCRTVRPHVTVRRTPTRRSHGLRLDEPTLVQFVLLSMLLHILAIVLFGATAKGGAGRGEGLPETLDVTLRPSATESRALRLPPREEASPAVPLSGRPAERPPRPAPGSASVSIQPQHFELIAPPAMAPSMPEPFLRPDVPQEIERDLSPAGPPKPQIEATPERLEPVAPETLQPRLEQPIEEPRALQPNAPSVPLERLTAPVERSLEKPLELPREALPVAPQAPIERTAAPAIEGDLAPSVEVPARPLPSSPTAPLEPVEPPSTRELAPPAELPPVRIPSPGAPEQTVTQPASSAQRPSVSAPSAAPAPTPESVPASRLGAPHPDEDIFRPREPGLDLEAAKKRAVREMAREGSGTPGVLPFPLPIPETKTKEAKAMEKAIKPDCRTAYSGMGLLAVPVLLAATITDEGCRW